MMITIECIAFRATHSKNRQVYIYQHSTSIVVPKIESSRSGWSKQHRILCVKFQWKWKKNILFDQKLFYLSFYLLFSLPLMQRTYQRQSHDQNVIQWILYCVISHTTRWLLGAINSVKEANVLRLKQRSANARVSKHAIHISKKFQILVHSIHGYSANTIHVRIWLLTVGNHSVYAVLIHRKELNHRLPLHLLMIMSS